MRDKNIVQLVGICMGSEEEGQPDEAMMVGGWAGGRVGGRAGRRAGKQQGESVPRSMPDCCASWVCHICVTVLCCPSPPLPLSVCRSRSLWRPGICSTRCAGATRRGAGCLAGELMASLLCIV